MDKNNKILNVENLSVAFGDAQILKDVSFNLEPKDWLMLLGPNGAGKSTCVYAMSRSVPFNGKIALKDKSIQEYNNIEYAKLVGFLSQKNLVAFDFTVEEIVSMGRYCHMTGVFRNLDKGDKDHIKRAMKDTGTYEFKDRSVQELSGGEVQRTFLAQVLAQDPEILVLDEPTNNLDLVYQSQIFDLIQNWIEQKGRCVISVVHDLGLASAFGNKAVLLDNGEVKAFGNTTDVVKPEVINSVFKIDVAQYLKKLYANFV